MKRTKTHLSPNLPAWMLDAKRMGMAIKEESERKEAQASKLAGIEAGSRSSQMPLGFGSLVPERDD